jgi:DNA invertase Pin-like site-specific DNA recombinase
MIPGTSRVASYIRNSEEDANPTRQRDTICGWLERHHLRLAQEYHDPGRRHHQLHDELKRPDWHNLIRDIRAGDWDVLVVDDCTRLGFITRRELVEIVGICEDNQVELWEASSDRRLCGDDITSIILNVVKADRNKAQLENLARTSLGGRLAQARKGCYTGGFVSYGTALSCQDAGRVERWRVEVHSGYRLELIHADGRVEWVPRVPRDRRPGEEIYQVLSKYPERLDVVQRSFSEYTTQAVSANAIAMQLNRDGIRAHTRSGLWYGSLIARTLRQPLYTGRRAFGKWTTHRYATVFDGVATNTRGNGRMKRKEHDEWVWTDRLFDGIVSLETFEVAQKRLSPDTRRAPSNPDLWLSGIVFCSGCSGRMSGWHAKDRTPRLSYRCDTAVRLGPNNSAGCWPHQVSQDVLVYWIDTYLADASQLLGHLTSGPPEGLIRRFWSERADCRARLRELPREAEDYLSEVQDEILPHEWLKGGRRRYEIDFGGDPIRLDLPGRDDPAGLEIAYE